VHACTGILFNHESPLRPERFVTKKIAVAVARIAAGKQRKLSLGNMSIKRDWGWAPEYVEAMWRMLQQESPTDLVIATGKLSTLEEFVAAAFATAGLDWREHVEKDPTLERPTDLQGFAGDARRAAQVLDWMPRTVMPDIARVMVEAELTEPKKKTVRA